MTTLFSSAPGKVTRVRTGREAIPFRMNLPGFPVNGAIVTRASLEHGGNYQFLHTTRDFIYVNIFGDRVGTVRVSGIAFLDQCPNLGGIGLTSTVSGIEQALSYYGRNRLSIRGAPVRIGFGTFPFEAFLVRGQFNARDGARNGSLGRFALEFKIFPEADTIPGDS